MAVRQHIFDTITQIFRRHGAVTIDTPVMELTEILAGKYGEDSKLIYDLADQGGEQCSLRYDLTVPFARYMAMHGKPSQYQCKRYQLAKVYRRDQPAMTKGRLREFYQCDFDIAGQYDLMIPDTEILCVLKETLDSLQLPVDYDIKLNHRQLLDGVFRVAGVAPDAVRAVSSTIDKLDKQPWTEVHYELMHERGLDKNVADRIGHYVQQNGDAQLLQKLADEPTLMANPQASQGIRELQLLMDYGEVFDIRDKIKVDLSLARGLDYYTGIIYEAVTHGTHGVGSIAAGGRYDDLVGMLLNKPNKKIPCVGVSIGVERIFSLLMEMHQQGHSDSSIRGSPTQVYVISVGDGLVKQRMQIAKELWDAGIAASYMYKSKPKLEKQWAVCDREAIPLAVIIGQDELDQGVVRIKDMSNKDEAQGKGQTLPRSGMVSAVLDRLSR
ncbi:histidyl-tRNA synthetase [Hesseltinella vesiculosa]|uniref:histidine--tRNA ligase n=1 Tax=Hesseltinella vesiculosa TaxID=101127 RepID=A0A1X2GEF1_9FUNG|nr:histidyl-tRNA synthetase [Hesseltinella vesiculosa]